MSAWKLCVLCRCPAVTEAHGFPVCTYHRTHGEDEPSCPTCRHPAPMSVVVNDTNAHDRTECRWCGHVGTEECSRLACADAERAYQARLGVCGTPDCACGVRR